MTTTPDTARWLRCPLTLDAPEARLVCFPHAGGSAAMFHPWGGRLPGVEVHAVCYPGRAHRIAEPPPADLRRLAAQITDALMPLADRPLILFGHSMGAAVALETAVALQERGVEPLHLFASGSRDAPYPEPEELSDPDELNDAAVVERLLTLGGTDPELAADPEFQELVLPYVRADGRMFHAYTPGPAPMLRCPVTTIVGDVDDDADRRPWSTLTSGPVREHGVRGDHFYLVDEPPLALLGGCLPVPARSGP
ncbi:thioesterase II family protein [Micromonospora sp. WMMA2032]|uniref:thioesterase II family protein n=1 Tax=Micromonospora sp. WMMA2032 TaxID=2039870 RepID=UPI0020A397F5|nr:alpha/beta fold hydrolase [Micromonospora sp. WMMA2032]